MGFSADYQFLGCSINGRPTHDGIARIRPLCKIRQEGVVSQTAFMFVTAKSSRTPGELWSTGITDQWRLEPRCLFWKVHRGGHPLLWPASNTRRWWWRPFRRGLGSNLDGQRRYERGRGGGARELTS
ncbi:uncharacterized protein TrAtP1_010483 [Trichoderma atroviride]|uniref:uncharacterized protein n=1 Tax=Hypocrea atroviridis TaxID=63577 RepID=UPI0033296EFA|nr:hypothetical protein TrAtP1_010483 [Trichoderma atroviride]